MGQLEASVALFLFNRPETTKRVFEAIRQARPRRLFVIADGPRAGVEGEAEKCRLAREAIQTIDWPCRVETNFSDVNLGCGRRMSSGIAWVFERTPEAIFLEDDCLPSKGFFGFCTSLLERYRDDDRIGMISGDNFLPADLPCPDSYYYSRYVHVWGWASWRRAWKSYDFPLSTLHTAESRNFFVDQFEFPEVGHYFRDKLVEISEGRLDTWDFQVSYSFLANSLLAVMPSRNLVSNIGFGPAATHTFDETSTMSRLAAHEPDHPLRHPPFIIPWRSADRYTEREVYGIRAPEIAKDPEDSKSADAKGLSEPGLIKRLLLQLGLPSGR